MKSNYKLMIAMAGGVIVGGVLAMLFAPGKGSDIRKKIREKGMKFTDGFSDMMDSARGFAEGRDDRYSKKMQPEKTPAM
ncbi:MAG TPA: YtxH domain-containing protein [Flavisolibacter sp.]